MLQGAKDHLNSYKELAKTYGGPQLSQQQQITHSTNQDIHSNNR